MPKRLGEEREGAQAKRHQSEEKSTRKSSALFKFHPQEPVVSFDSEDSDSEEDFYKGISFAQDPAEDLGDDLFKDNKPAPSSSAKVIPIAKPVPQPVFIEQVAQPTEQNKPIVSPEKPRREVSWDRDLIVKDPADCPSIKIESELGMGKNLPPRIIEEENNDSQPLIAEHANSRDLNGNSGYFTGSDEAG